MKKSNQKVTLGSYIAMIKSILKKDPSKSVSEIADMIITSMDKSAITVERLGSNDDNTIKRGLKRAFGYERKIKQSKG